MVRQVRPVGQRARFATKAELLAGGADVRAGRYQRASQDKKEQGKSVGDQGKLNRAEIDRYSWTCPPSMSFTDNDLSASRHAKKARPDFERLMDAIRDGKLDVLVVWEISRNQRDLAVYVQIRDLCTQVGMHFWLVGGVLYDLRDKNDRMMLGFQAVQAEWLADSIRDNVLRGIVGAAEAGRPHGKVTYGFRRVYDQRTRAFLRQEADDELRAATAPENEQESTAPENEQESTASETEQESTYSRVGVVREIFAKITSGVPLITIEQQLNARGVPSPEGSTWRRGVIRKMALNPAYIGKRVLRGAVVGDGQWDGLVDEETFWAAVRLLEDPSRTTTRAGRAVHLLSYVVRCGVCDGPLSMTKVNRHGWQGQVYSCLKKRCAAVTADVLDEFVQRAVVAWLARPEVFADLTADATSDEQVAHARAEAQRLRAELEEWRKLAERGEVTAISFARSERGLLAQIEAHEAAAKEAGIPPVLRGRIGEDAVSAWAALGDEVAVKRDIINTVADIRLLRAGKGSRKPFGRHRLEWTWKFGEQTALVGDPQPRSA